MTRRGTVASGGGTLRERIAALPSAARERFHAYCDEAEEALLAGQTIAACVARIPTDYAERDLMLVNLGLCWLETAPAPERVRQAREFLGLCGDLAQQQWAVAELTGVADVSPPTLTTTTPGNGSTASFVPGSRVPLPPTTATGAAGAGTLNEPTAAFQLPPGYVQESQFPPSGMGLVLLVTNQRQGINRKEVLKTIKPKHFGDPELVRRFRSEARKLTQIKHPAVVTVYAADEHEGWPYYTMEYLEGGSLGERLKRGPLPPRQAVTYMAQMARALHRIHREAGFSHRDVKPHNMGFTKGDGTEEQIKLTDFGLAKQFQTGKEPLTFSTAQDSVPLGTPGFIAPEQLSEAFRPSSMRPEQLAFQSDLFALGASLYQCLCGRLPYQLNAEGADLLGPVVNDFAPPSRFAPGIDAAVDDLCARALRKNPAERFPSVEDFAMALDNWLDNHAGDDQRLCRRQGLSGQPSRLPFAPRGSSLGSPPLVFPAVDE